MHSLLWKVPGTALVVHASVLVPLSASVLVTADSVLVTADSVLGLCSSLGHTLEISLEEVLLGSALWESLRKEFLVEGRWDSISLGGLMGHCLEHG